jgi:hypothetical protein
MTKVFGDRDFSGKSTEARGGKTSGKSTHYSTDFPTKLQRYIVRYGDRVADGCPARRAVDTRQMREYIYEE